MSDTPDGRLRQVWYDFWPMNQTTMGQKIKAARLERELSTTGLAALCSVSERTVVRWENDDNVPSGRFVTRLAQALNVSPLWLLDEPNGNGAEVAA